MKENITILLKLNKEQKRSLTGIYLIYNYKY
jgi:hypothetical protein